MTVTMVSSFIEYGLLAINMGVIIWKSVQERKLKKASVGYKQFANKKANFLEYRTVNLEKSASLKVVVSLKSLKAEKDSQSADQHPTFEKTDLKEKENGGDFEAGLEKAENWIDMLEKPGLEHDRLREDLLVDQSDFIGLNDGIEDEFDSKVDSCRDSDPVAENKSPITFSYLAGQEEKGQGESPVNSSEMKVVKITVEKMTRRVLKSSNAATIQPKLE